MLADRGRRISLADVARLAVKMGWDYLIVDGVHVPAVTFGRKTGGQRAFYSGKHKRHGLNVQTVCSPDGELLWAAAPQPGATVDVTAARKAGIAAMLSLADRRVRRPGVSRLGPGGDHRPPQAAGQGADRGAAGREPAAGPAPLRRRARQRPPEVLEGPGHRAALPPGAAAPPWSRRSWPCTTWNTTRSPPCAPRDRPDRYQAATPAPPAAPYSRGRSKNPPEPAERTRPVLSNRDAPCDNSG